MEKITALIFFLCIEFVAFSQTAITLIIKDADTKEPLPYCNVAIKGTDKGGITNNDGKIKLTVNSENDIIEISYLGYETKLFKINELNNTNTIFLKAKSYVLNEVDIVANFDYYEVIDKCRKKMLSYNKKSFSKTYYSVETSTNNKPLEFLECFYNSKFQGVKLDSLFFKNGRTFLQHQDNFLLTYNTSLAITMFDLLYSTKDYPTSILNYNKVSMKRLFEINVNNEDNNYFLIEFHPKKDKNNYFYGQLWIEKNSFNLIKVDLSIKNTTIHPFVAFGFDEMSNVSLNFSERFKIQDNNILPEYIKFDYSFDYLSKSAAAINKINPKVVQYNVESECFMYFYDYGNNFILPFFCFPEMDFYGRGDYQKLQAIPFNKVFWENNNQVLLSDNQIKKLKIITNSVEDYEYNSENDYGFSFLSYLTKYFDLNENQIETKKDKTFLEYSYVFWNTLNPQLSFQNIGYLATVNVFKKICFHPIW